MIAQAILTQLGGPSRLGIMIGAKLFTDTGSGATFRFAGNPKVGNHVRIEVDATDTYHVTFHFIRGTNFRVTREYTGIYADGLRAIFEQHTGLYLSLGTMGA